MELFRLDDAVVFAVAVLRMESPMELAEAATICDASELSEGDEPRLATKPAAEFSRLVANCRETEAASDDFEAAEAAESDDDDDDCSFTLVGGLAVLVAVEAGADEADDLEPEPLGATVAR